MRLAYVATVCIFSFAGCGDPTASSNTSFGTEVTSETTMGASGGTQAATTRADGTTAAASGHSTGVAPIFDVGANGETETTGGIGMSCKVGDDIDAPQPCVDVAPPDSFEPAVQWQWLGGANGQSDVLATPLVANLTDDNGDGAIDLCDIPDVVVIATAGSAVGPGNIYVLDGATGTEHFRIETQVYTPHYPALGDLDGDGVPEIVAATLTNLIAFRHDGTVLWHSTDTVTTASNAISLADLEADGDVEIIFDGAVFDHNGVRQWAGVTSFLNTAADLDDDGDLEVITGGSAYDPEGNLLWSSPDESAHPHVADLDLDGQPEVLFVSLSGITVVQHDGTVTVTDAVPNLSRWRPAAIHDMDGDGAPEIAIGAADSYSVIETDLSANWTATVADNTGYAAGTAFDFLGDGSAEAMYADESTLFVFDDAGNPLLTTPRTSWTQWENPIVVDVDNDGSAEIVVVSNGSYGIEGSPPVQVIRDVEDRWIPARRIWNQHGYHVTNVREDGTIPTVQPKNWLTLNTFRTQAQIGVDGVCEPAG